MSKFILVMGFGKWTFMLSTKHLKLQANIVSGDEIYCSMQNLNQSVKPSQKDSQNCQAKILFYKKYDKNHWTGKCWLYAQLDSVLIIPVKFGWNCTSSFYGVVGTSFVTNRWDKLCDKQTG
jgi:hypothetical protein